MKESNALKTIALAGLIAGNLDITSAFVIAAIKGVAQCECYRDLPAG